MYTTRWRANVYVCKRPFQGGNYYFLCGISVSVFIHFYICLGSLYVMLRQFSFFSYITLSDLWF